MLTNRTNNILGQILFWSLTWLFLTFMLSNGWEDPQRFFLRSIDSLLGIAMIASVNLRYLLPHFYFAKRHILFILSGILLIISLTFLLHWDYFPWVEWLNKLEHPDIGGPRRRKPDSGFRWFVRSMPFIITFLGSTVFEITNYANRKEKEVIQSQKERLETEIKFLRSQINPHFLFNALNNIYTLTLLQSQKAPENLLRLSEMLRYMLYDCDAEQVSLQKEIVYLRNYINLQQLKDSEGLNVIFELDESQSNLRIPPLLLIPFVENAFKHSKIEDQEEGWIKIKLQTSMEALFFEVQNSLPSQEYTKDEVGGIGLENVKRRLELLYPEKHQLRVETQADKFLIQLELNLA